MSNLSIALPAVQRKYDRQSPDDRSALYDAADEAENDFKPVMRVAVTDAEIDAVIEQIAETGFYENELGAPVKAGELIQALALDWIDNRMGLPGYTNAAFRKWATATAALAKYGK